MSQASPLVAPTPLQPTPSSATLAPPAPSRSISASSGRSSGSASRRGRSPNSSNNVSRSNSHSSSASMGKKQSGATTTISGGISLGAKNSNGDTQANKAGNPKKSVPQSLPVKEEKVDSGAGDKGKKTQNQGNKKASSNAKGRPNPINTAPPAPHRTSSQTSAAGKSATTANDKQSQSAPAPRSLHAAVSTPRTALEAAAEAASQKQGSTAAQGNVGGGGGDVFANLQKIISDMRSIPNTSGPSSATSLPGSRSTSGTKEPATATPTSAAKPVPSPVAITSSTSAGSAKKQLKADAPTFTPSFQPSISPVASQAAISPGTTTVPLWGQPRSTSVSNTSAARRVSSGAAAAPGLANLSSLRNMPNLNASPVPVFAGTVPDYPLYQNQLHVHPEADNEDLSPMSFTQHSEAQYQQQQLLAAQQLQFQQIQLLQAQLAAQQAQNQQHQQHQHQPSMGSFIAPRFQALAIQRAAQQQAQQAQQLAQAQQLYELQQAQVLEVQRQREAQLLAQAQVQAQATLNNPPPVFEEDSPEPAPASLGPTGRPQLAPTFTFGAKKAAAEAAERSSMSPPLNPPVINRSEGIGGAQATGLAGLAARAHKRTGSELTPAMQQQLDIQTQIEALQAKQKALMQEELASQGLPAATSLSQIGEAFGHKQTPSQTLNRYRQRQSIALSTNLEESSGGLELGELPEGLPRPGARGLGEMLPPPVPVTSAAAAASHGRRHSVNIFNKTAGHGAGFSISSDIPEDIYSNGSISISGPGNGNGHQRSGSRSGFESGSWRSTAQANGGGNGMGPVTDLASAQAQLQSLAQFRAAAGGGHSKMASFSFPNMLPNLLAATTLQTPAGQSLWQQQQAFQMQLQQTTQGPQRKSLFAPYLPQASLPPLLQAGKLVVGVLRVNKKNRSDAYVATDVLEADIYICGSKDRNRALEGDIVAIELLDVDEVWSTKKDKEDKKRKKEENSVYDLKPSVAKKLEKKKDDVEVEGQGLTLFDDEEVNDETKPTYAGHVVAVVERMPGQLFSGQLGVLRPSSAATKEKQEIERREREGDRPGHGSISQSISRREDLDGNGHASRPKIVWFKPTDKRVPLIAIPTEQAPADFIDNPDTYTDRLFVATIKRWPITSLHPFGTLVEELGPIGNVEVETSALLKDCNFPTEEFTDVTMKCLPPLPWSIPEREYDIRTDLREDRVFTIDPPSAKDLDDALSIKKNENGTYTVGVHIADVSYFVKSNTAMDREARKRATSVYLVQRSVPMLPPQLSEQLCSLQPGVERLAFTASFEIDERANIVGQTFARTIIKSCGKLAYSDAQSVIEGGKLGEDKVKEHETGEVEGDIKALHEIASKLRKKRQEAGAMMQTKIKVSFKLDDEGKPVDCEAGHRNDANVLVEEFMLLANTSVARAIAFGLPEQSLLRRHEAPIERRIEGFVDRAHKLGYHFDATSAGTLQKVFDGISDADQDVALCLELLKRKAMQRARYFCTGMLDIAKYAHWSLNVPLYTHFTSPIRRYADVLVHRMLDACLTSPNPLEVKFHMDRDQVAKCAQQCNMKKQNAKLAEDQSTHLYLCMLIHDLTEKYGPVVREGRVTGVLDAAFDVVIPEFGIEKRVHVDKMPVNNTVYDEHRDILSLYWTNQDVLTYLATTLEDPHFLKLKSLGDHHASETTRSDALLAPDLASKQYAKSANRGIAQFEGLRKDVAGGHRVQDIKELMKVEVIVVSDITKSPPVLVVYACNPYAPN